MFRSRTCRTAAGYLTAAVTPSGVLPVSDTVRYCVLAVSLGTVLGGAIHEFCGVTVDYTPP